MLSRATSTIFRRSLRISQCSYTATNIPSICTTRCPPTAHKITRNYVTPTLRTMLPIKIVEVPTMGDSITEGTIVDLPVGPGDYVNTDEVVVVLETDKVSVDVRATEPGKIVEILGEIDDVVEVGSNLFRIDTDAEAPEGGAAPAAETAPEPEAAAVPEAAAAPEAPPAAAAAPPAAAPAAPTPPPPPATPAPPTTSWTVDPITGKRTERRTKMSTLRKRVAERLKSAQNTAALLTTFQEVDMSSLMSLRSKYKDDFAKKHGVKLGFMSCFIKASTMSLQEIPAVNAYIDDEAQEIVYREFVDISVAVASPKGLVVPVLRNTEDMNFADVEKSIATFGQKAKEGTLSLEEMQGGTFTISNGGVFGSLMGTPILNLPQSAILGMHSIKMRPVVNEKGEIVPKPMMYLALTYDHRLIDGREAVTFLKSIAEKVSDPARMILDL